MSMMKKITFITGYYGSGKTEITVNLAVQKQLNMIIDLDIINPYFRSREMEEQLEPLGIQTISSDLDYKSHIDLPYISKKIFLPFHNDDLHAIYDLGGNDLGAKLLRQFENYRERDVDLFLVINIYRIETSSADKIIQLINQIEGMGGFSVTGLINNSNLLKETTKENILDGQAVIEEVMKKTNLPLVYTTVWDQLEIDTSDLLGEVVKLKLYYRKDWL